MQLLFGMAPTQKSLIGTVLTGRLCLTFFDIFTRSKQPKAGNQLVALYAMRLLVNVHVALRCWVKTMQCVHLLLSFCCCHVDIASVATSFRRRSIFQTYVLVCTCL